MLQTPTSSGLPRPLWLVGVLALLTWQGWLTLALFGDDPRENILNDQPVLSGSHPQKFYIGLTGAKAVVQQGRTSVYDHRFQSGWLKTPIFDGSRLAELFLLVGGGTYKPAAYKIGFAIVCLIVPVLLLTACRTIGLGYATSLLATFIGQLVWWGPHGRAAMITGECELYLAALMGLTHVGFLLAYHRTTSVWSWFGLWLTGCLCWFLQPLLFPIALPVLLVYYLSVGAKHDFLTWHFAFWGAELLAVIVNLPWLFDWLDSWWLRTPLPISADMLEHRTIVTVWNAPIWGGPTSRMLAIFIMASATVGVIILNQTRERPAARLLGGASSGALLMAFLGISWEPLGALGTAALLAPSLWFACIPAAHGWVWLTEKLWRRGTFGRVLLMLSILGTISAFCLLTEAPASLLDRCIPGTPLEIGLGPDRRAIVDALIEMTEDDARIVWEDRSRSRQASRWAALLPTLTQRSYIGGLDPDGFIEHSSISLINQSVGGQPITAWKNEDFAEYCRLYNVRWVVAWSPALIEKLSAWPVAKKRLAIVDDDSGWLFEIERTPNFALKGRADLLEVNGRYIMLGNVVPHQGEVVLSLHYQAGMRASLPRVQIEADGSAARKIDFVRLKLTAEAKRVTLTWER